MKQLNEKYGIVNKLSHKWDKLANAIVEYLYDGSGLANDLDLLVDGEITLSMIKSFYRGTHHVWQVPSDLIPEWLNDFSIYIKSDTDNLSNGYVDMKKVTYEEGKINCCMHITFDLSKPRSVDGVINTIMHEFRHLYTCWLEHKYTFKITTDKRRYIYNKYMQISKSIPLSQKNGSFEYHMAELAYLTMPDEINAFMQAYDNETKELIRNNVDKITAYMQSVKGGKINSSDDSEYPAISPVKLRSYKIYCDALAFINNMAEKLEKREICRDDLADTVYSQDLRDIINAFLLNDDTVKKGIILDTNINLIYMPDDMNDEIYIKSYYILADLLLKYLKKVKPYIERTISDMDMLFIYNVRKICR